jgi:hypothetical protein
MTITDRGRDELTKRLRHRRCYAKEYGAHAQWMEWQVVQGRKIVSRFDLETQADEYIAEHSEPRT